MVERLREHEQEADWHTRNAWSPLGLRKRAQVGNHDLRLLVAVELWSLGHERTAVWPNGDAITSATVAGTGSRRKMVLCCPMVDWCTWAS
jgi:hypothetical protein